MAASAPPPEPHEMNIHQLLDAINARLPAPIKLRTLQQDLSSLNRSGTRGRSTVPHTYTSDDLHALLTYRAAKTPGALANYINANTPTERAPHHDLKALLSSFAQPISSAHLHAPRIPTHQTPSAAPTQTATVQLSNRTELQLPCGRYSFTGPIPNPEQAAQELLTALQQLKGAP